MSPLKLYASTIPIARFYMATHFVNMLYTYQFLSHLKWLTCDLIYVRYGGEMVNLLPHEPRINLVNIHLQQMPHSNSVNETYFSRVIGHGRA